MKLVKSLFKMLNISDKYIEINETIEKYSAIHSAIAQSIGQYESDVEKIAKDNEHKLSNRASNQDFQTKEYKRLYKNIEALMLTGIKEKYLELREFGLVVDNIMESFVEKDGMEKVFKVFGHKLSKHSIIDFDESMLFDENVSIVDFPEMKKDDAKTYAKKMELLLEDIEKARENIRYCEQALQNLEEGDPLIVIFSKMKGINESNLSTFEVDYLREVKFTKNMLDKTLNFFPVPKDISKETVALHAYLRKLVDFEILKSDFFYKRFTNTLPECMDMFKEDLGFFILDEERANAKKDVEKEANETNEAIA